MRFAIGLIGCLQSALNDAEQRRRQCISDRVAVPEENKFVGFDGYKKAMALADVVILNHTARLPPHAF
jgi:myo-inositol 2-dehydrogenase/D-chiro-inositol 1-dehydrogenase